MIYPIQGDYDLAMQNFGTFVVAPRFRGGLPQRGKHGLVSYSGGFCIVYPVDLPTGTEALRCWIKDPGDVKLRWGAASAYLARRALPYFADFGHIDAGIIVNGARYPIGHMRWLAGLTLRRFIEANVGSRAAMLGLAEGFLAMVSELHTHRISHGDLQDGNIVMCEGPGGLQMRLVDYDSLYVPTLPPSAIDRDPPGIPAYQHPHRASWGNERADYFSELVIYLSLRAYAERPELWVPGQEKRLLFTEHDFARPDASPAFAALRACSPAVRRMGEHLRGWCLGAADAAEPLERVAVTAATTVPRARGWMEEAVSAARRAVEPKAAIREAQATEAHAREALAGYFAPKRPPPRPTAPTPTPRKPPPARPRLALNVSALGLAWARSRIGSRRTWVSIACAGVGAGWGALLSLLVLGFGMLLTGATPSPLAPAAMAAFGGVFGHAARRFLWPAVARRGLQTSARFGAVGVAGALVLSAFAAANAPPDALGLLPAILAGVFGMGYLGLLVGTADGLLNRA